MYWIYKGFGNNYHHRRMKYKLEIQLIENMKLNNILRSNSSNTLGMEDHLIRTYLQRVAG